MLGNGHESDKTIRTEMFTVKNKDVLTFFVAVDSRTVRNKTENSKTQCAKHS